MAERDNGTEILQRIQEINIQDSETAVKDAHG